MKELNNTKKHPFVNFLLILSLLFTLGYFGVSLYTLKDDPDILNKLVSILLFVMFTLFFVASSITTNKNKKNTIGFTALILIIYSLFQTTNTLGIKLLPERKIVEDFTGKSLTEVISWSKKNNVELETIYEYSDLIDEYHVINQDKKANTLVKNIEKLTVAISEGANPSKEVMIPNIVGWSDEEVIKFVNDNLLSNVEISFITSAEKQDTVIEQSKTGTMKRNDELKITFSLGEEITNNEVKMIDLVGKSKFETEFFLKQHSIKYTIKEDFSKKIKKNYTLNQSIKPGEMVKINDDEVTITISKGPKIIVPDLKSMSLEEITEWIIENKLKIEIDNKYDDTIKEDKVIKSNYEKDDEITQGTKVEVTISKGKLKMPKNLSISEFKTWADKYEVNYEEKYEFSDDVKEGELISFSHKEGEIIKNNDTVVITISQGKETKVPDLIGLSKKNATSKLKDVGLNYNFVYKNSSKVAKDVVMAQSISAGSKVSNNTTITVTLSNGKKESTSTENSKNNNSTSSNSTNNSSSNNNSSTPSQEEICVSQTYTIGRDLINIFNNYSGYNTVKTKLEEYFSNNYKDVNFYVKGVDGGDATSGSYIGGIAPGTSVTSCNGVTYTIEIAK